MTAHELFHAGQLREAVAACIAEVRAHPSDVDRRLFLGDLLCFTGDLERADTHFDAAGQLDAKSMPWVVTCRQLIRAEQARRDVFTSGRLPEFLSPPDETVRSLIEASLRIREDALPEARALLDQAEQQRPKLSGTGNDQPFTDFRDLDDLTCCVFEVLTSQGKYYWVPMADVDSIEFHEPTLARDLCWRRVVLSVRNGPDGEVFLPVLYPGSHAEEDVAFALGRTTDWRGGDGTPVRGVGQRTFLVGDDAVPILELKSLTFNHPEPA